MRRSSGGTSAAIACRPIDIAGSTRIPPANPHTSSSGYGRNRATSQNAVSPIVVMTSILRRPYRSTTRPMSGAPSAMPIVATAPTVPAAP